MLLAIIIIVLVAAVNTNNFMPAAAMDDDGFRNNTGRHGSSTAVSAEQIGVLQAHVAVLQDKIQALEMKMKEQEKAAVERKTTAIKWRLCNPENNEWAKYDNARTRNDWNSGFAVHPFTVEPAGKCGAQEEEGGLVVQVKYFEVTDVFYPFRLGLSATNNHSVLDYIGDYAHSYAYEHTASRDRTLDNEYEKLDNKYFYSGYARELQFEWPAGKPILNRRGRRANTFGCGLVISSDTGRRAIFFTVNGILLGQIDINAANLSLYPAISGTENGVWQLWDKELAANFGNRPFFFDVTRFPGVKLPGRQDDHN